jgi:uncharacterized protein with PIN domain
LGSTDRKNSRQHHGAAAQNFGNVFGCALSKVRGVPLLFKGSDTLAMFHW